MATTPGPFTKTDAKGRQPSRSIPVSLTVDQFVALLVVALMASWLGFYIITPLPYLELSPFRPTITLHLVTGIVMLPYLASLIIARRLPGGSPLDAPVMAMLGVYLLTTATSLNWRVSLEVALVVLMAAAVFYVLSDFRLFRRWQVEGALMLAVLAAATKALWIVGGDYVDWLRLTDVVRGGISAGDLIPPTVIKVRDVGDFRNYLGSIFAMSLPFFFVALFRPIHAGLRLLVGLGAVAIVLALFFTLTRSAWLGGAGGVTVTLLLLAAFTPGVREFFRRLRPTTSQEQLYVGVIAFGLALAVLATAYAVSEVETRPIWLFRESYTPRVDAMQAGVEMVRDYPLLGTGPGVYRLLYPEYSGRFGVYAIHSHNGFLQAAIDMGVPGVLALLAMAGALGWILVRGLRQTDGDARLSLIACSGSLVAFATFSLADAPNGFKGPLVALAAVGAVAVLAYRERRGSGPADGVAGGWAISGRWLSLAARAAIPIAIAGLLITWGRIDVGHYFYDASLTAVRAQRWEEAVDEAQRAVDLDPEFAIYRLQLGVIQGQAYLATDDQSMLADAIGQLERGLELEPRSALGYTNLALLLARTDDREGTRDAALKAIEFANRDVAVVLAAGTALEMSNWGEEAVDAYAEALFLDLGLANSSFWSESSFRVTRFSDIVASSAVVLNDCALLWLLAQPVPAGPVERQDALTGCVERVLERDIREDRIVLAEALIRDGEMELAGQQIDNVLARYPDFGAGRTALGRWYAALGDLDRARLEWLRAGQLEEVEALVLLGDSYPPGQVPGEVVDALRDEVRSAASEVQFHLTGILYYRFKFFRASPPAILLPGDWKNAVPGRYTRATETLARWESEG